MKANQQHSYRRAYLPRLIVLTCIAIIGAGAAGMMAAAKYKNQDLNFKVFLVEKRGLGHKVIISGGGRCNVTTGQEDMRVILDCYPREVAFNICFDTAFHRLWCASGLNPEGAFKVRKDLRIFPKSNDGKDVVRVLNVFLEQMEHVCSLSMKWQQ